MSSLTPIVIFLYWQSSPLVPPPPKPEVVLGALVGGAATVHPAPVVKK